MNGCMYGGEKGGPADVGYQASQTRSRLGGHERSLILIGGPWVALAPGHCRDALAARQPSPDGH